MSDIESESRKRRAVSVSEYSESSDEERTKKTPAAKTSKSGGGKTKAAPAPRKKKTQKPKSSSGNALTELFGSEEEPVAATSASQQVWSSFSRRVAGGIVRHNVQLEGPLFAELRVYDVSAIKDIDLKDRWTKASVSLRLQLDVDDPQWGIIKKIIKDSRKKFEGDGTFYADKK